MNSTLPSITFQCPAAAAGRPDRQAEWCFTLRLSAEKISPSRSITKMNIFMCPEYVSSGVVQVLSCSLAADHPTPLAGTGPFRGSMLRSTWYSAPKQVEGTVLLA